MRVQFSEGKTKLIASFCVRHLLIAVTFCAIPLPPLAPLRGGGGNCFAFCFLDKSALFASKSMTVASLRALACFLKKESATCRSLPIHTERRILSCMQLRLPLLWILLRQMAFPGRVASLDTSKFLLLVYMVLPIRKLLCRFQTMGNPHLS